MKLKKLGSVAKCVGSLFCLNVAMVHQSTSSSRPATLDGTIHGLPSTLPGDQGGTNEFTNTLSISMTKECKLDFFTWPVEGYFHKMCMIFELGGILLEIAATKDRSIS